MPKFYPEDAPGAWVWRNYNGSQIFAAGQIDLTRAEPPGSPLFDVYASRLHVVNLDIAALTFSVTRASGSAIVISSSPADPWVTRSGIFKTLAPTGGSGTADLRVLVGWRLP